MSTITLELPDSASALLERLTPENKKRLGAFVQFWLTSFSDIEKQTALKAMKSIQQQVVSKNLSKEQVQELINASMT